MNARSATDTQDLLDALDRHKEAKGTLALFDALFVEDADAVYYALTDHLTHPLSDRLGVWLEARGVARPAKPSSAEILERRGVTDVDAWITRHEKEMAAMKEELEVARRLRNEALIAANSFSAILVVFVAVAVLGWLAAFGVLPFSPQRLPEGMPEAPKSKGGPESTGPGAEI